MIELILISAFLVTYLVLLVWGFTRRGKCAIDESVVSEMRQQRLNDYYNNPVVLEIRRANRRL